MKTANLIVIALLLAIQAVYATESIIGTWKTESGELAEATPCKDGICLTLKTCKYTGKQIGALSGEGSAYNGTVTDPKDDKVYSGTANISQESSGEALKLKGCVLKVLCKSQTWKKVPEAQ